VGIRYKCRKCLDTDICESCKAQGLHDPTHPLLEITEERGIVMTPEEKAAEIAKLEARARAINEAQEAESKQEAKRRELERRKTGKERQEAKERFEEDQLSRLEKERKKEAAAERAARDRIRGLIEQDKAERHARLAGEDPYAANLAAAEAANRKHIHVDLPPVNEVTIRARMMDGTVVEHVFAPSARIADLYDWIREERKKAPPPPAAGAGGSQQPQQDTSPEGFSLMTTAPRRVFGAADMNMTLVAANLAPRSCIIVAKRKD